MKKHLFLPVLLLGTIFTSCETGDDTGEKEKPPKPVEYTISVSVDGTGGTALPTVADEAVTKAEAGTEVTLTASPDSDYDFVEWSTTTSGVVIADPTAVSTTFTMPEANVAITAKFESIVLPPPPPTKYTITVNPATGGTGAASIADETVLEAAEGDEITLIATHEGSYRFVRWTMTTAIDNHKIILTTSPAKFTMPAGDITIDVRFAVPPAGGVIIGGAVWATCNVGAPGTFVATPESPGQFYQWGRNIAWSAADPLIASDGRTEWDETYYDEGDEWLPENDPSPDGWRVPMVDDFRNLLNVKNIEDGIIVLEWVAAAGAKSAGRRLTDTTTGNSIFFPASGWRTFGTDTIFGYVGGALKYVGTDGFYWSASAAGADRGYDMTFDNGSVYPAGNSLRNYGFSIRPVAE